MAMMAGTPLGRKCDICNKRIKRGQFWMNFEVHAEHYDALKKRDIRKKVIHDLHQR